MAEDIGFAVADVTAAAAVVRQLSARLATHSPRPCDLGNVCLVRLASVQIRNFRSYFTEGRDRFSLELSEGVTTIVGPNNCGKSNLLRAIALAMSPDTPFEPEKDCPMLGDASPRLLLTFHVPGRTAGEKALLKVANTYERSVQGPGLSPGTYADDGEIRLSVRFTRSERHVWRRDETVTVKGVGGRRGDPEDLTRLLAMLRAKIAFIAIPSGESLTTVISRHLRVSLRSALDRSQRGGLARATEHRNKLEAVLRNDVFGTLESTVTEFLRQVFPDVQSVELGRIVPTLDELLAEIEFRVTDVVATELERKGTGLRSGLIVALLRHLAQTQGQSLVIGLEEPESFIHPAAQDRVLVGLEEIAANSDVTLLVTTHSPHVITRQPRGSLVALRKRPDGSTVVSSHTSGDQVSFDTISELYSGGAIPELLRDAGEYPPGTERILVVEGTTDRDYLLMATEVLERRDLLDGLLVLPAGGATKAVTAAIVHRAAEGALPIFLLFDTDDAGRNARNMATDKFGFQARDLLTYGQAFEQNVIDIEAEDLFPNGLLERFIDEYGDEVYDTKSRVRGIQNHWHYGFTAVGKEQLPDWLLVNAQPADYDRFTPLLNALESGFQREDLRRQKVGTPQD